MESNRSNVGWALMTMKLCCTYSTGLHKLDDPQRELVAENADGENLWRQTTSDVVHLLHSNLANRRGKDKPNGVGSESDCKKGIVFIRDATNFHEHDITVLS
jgi:hypothetical protein